MRRSRMAIGGSLLAAGLSSACCWLPAALALAGIPAAGAAIGLEAMRPWLIGVAAACVLVAAWIVERRASASRDCCAPADRCQVLKRRMTVGFAALAVGGLALLPPKLAASPSVAKAPKAASGAAVDACGCPAKSAAASSATAQLIDLRQGLEPLEARFNSQDKRIRFLAILSPS